MNNEINTMLKELREHCKKNSIVFMFHEDIEKGNYIFRFRKDHNAIRIIFNVWELLSTPPNIVAQYIYEEISELFFSEKIQFQRGMLYKDDN